MDKLRTILALAGRTLLLMLAAVFVHQLTFWLWNPRVAVGEPRFAKPETERQGTPAKPAEVVLLAFGGDTALTDSALPTLERRGYEHALAGTMYLFRDADLGVVNLETAVAHRDTPFPLYKNYVYRMEPKGLAALRWAGIDAVSLANNHIKDHDGVGLVRTLEHLDKAGIVGFGAGRNADEARRGVVLDVAGVRVGLLGYLEDSFMDSLYMQSFAWGWRPGCARLELGALRRDIARLKKRADIVIVMPHWGRNYTGVTTLQRFYGKALIDAGADAVIGAHPHVHHPVALYRGKPIVYSLGNYAFGTPGQESLRYGLVARLWVRDKRLQRLELVPLLIQNRIVNYKPEPLVGHEARKMLRKLAQDSAREGAVLRIEGGRALLDLPRS